jgi:hypothetical protein
VLVSRPAFWLVFFFFSLLFLVLVGLAGWLGGESDPLAWGDHRMDLSVSLSLSQIRGSRVGLKTYGRAGGLTILEREEREEVQDGIL